MLVYFGQCSKLWEPIRDKQNPCQQTSHSNRAYILVFERQTIYMWHKYVVCIYECMCTYICI